jgi:predicted transposase/invertase (TIGR01784 family)
LSVAPIPLVPAGVSAKQKPLKYDNHVFYEKLTFIYLEMPKFVKTEDELVTMFDKWMFVLHNLHRLLERPKALQDRVFQKLFEQAEIAKYSDAERRQYEESKKVFGDNYSVMKTAREKGVREGVQKEKAETIQRMKAKGFSIEDIVESVDLSIDEVMKLMQ